MGSSERPWRAAALLFAAFLPSIGCQRFLKVFTPRPQQAVAPGYAIDEPPPLHTGGLGVLGSTPMGQGPGASPASAGSPVAGGLATGIGLLVVGATAVKTAASCAKPDASPACLSGPSAADSVRDGGTP